MSRLVLASLLALACPCLCCDALPELPTPPDYPTTLSNAVAAYEKSSKYQNKISELHGKKKLDSRVGEIFAALSTLMKKGTHRILDLGAGAGTVAMWTYEQAMQRAGSPPHVVAVELARVGIRGHTIRRQQGRGGGELCSRRHHQRESLKELRPHLLG